ncbi:hypothetical protein ACHAPG_011582, partial [Botrytis cinerea]
MVFKSEICSDADKDRTFEIVSHAFGHDIEAAFPAHDTPTGRALGSSRMSSMKRTDPSITFLKVTDTDKGIMIAQAKWNIYKNTAPKETDLDENFWETDEEKLYAQLMRREYLIPRRKAIEDSGGNILSLDMLTVDPKYQSRGAGRLLTVVEATESGRPLYESEGFQYIDRWETRFPPKWESRDKQQFLWMTRPAKQNNRDGDLQ